MKKFVLAFCTLVFVTSLFSQKPAIVKVKPPLTAKDSLLCKAWKATSVERFGVISVPDATQKNDGVTFVLDGTAFITIEGVIKTGTWVTDKPKAYVIITVPGDKWSHRLKILNLTKDEFLFEYQDAELMRTKYTCKPIKK